MLGELVTNCLVLVLGYAYPAFECFKTVEKNRVEKAELRFWCQYWIIVALLTVLERIGDVFISWVPMYGEVKLALFIYLWYPKTKGSDFIYDSLLRPFLAKHETDMERNLQELRVKAWDVAIYYWHNCTELSLTKLFETFEYLASNPSKITDSCSKVGQNKTSGGRPPPPPNTPYTFFGRSSSNNNLAVSKISKSKAIQVRQDKRGHAVYADELHISESDNRKHGHFWLRFRRSKSK